MKMEGLFRLSFNRSGAAPLVWSVAPLDSSGAPIMDIAVPGFTVEGLNVATVYQPKSTPDDEDGRPSAYLVVEGELSFYSDGVARLRPRSVPR